jgi:hypothetical protein
VGDPGLNSLLVPRVYPSSVWRDMMSYCDNLWISDYTYNGIYDQLTSAAAQATVAVPAAGEYLQVSGVIFTESQEASIPQLRLWASLPTAPTAPTPGDYRLRLLGSGGTELAGYAFTPLADAEVANVLHVGEIVPYDSGTTKVEITHPGSSTTLWSYEPSANAPTVSNVQLVGAPSPVTGTVTLEWSAHDDDGDDLTFDVLYSSDDGANWQMVRMGATSTSTSIDTSTLAGSGKARLKVLAQDGFYQGEGMTAAFEMDDKAPIVTLLSPADGAEFALGQQIQMAAEVYDLQDGTLPASAIQWRDQTAYLLGAGYEIWTSNVLPGQNQISVKATNSRGKSTTVTFDIYVNDDLALPGSSLSVAPDQVGWHVGEGTTSLQTATVRVSNAGEGTLKVTASEDAPWLTVGASGNTTPMTLTLTADPAFLAEGESLGTTLEVVGNAGGGDQQVDVPVSFSMGNVFDISTAGDSKHRVYLPVILR